MLISGYHSQMDKEVWEKDGAKSVTEFWAERFLEDCPQPERSAEKVRFAGIEQNSKEMGDSKAAKFSLDGGATAWLPYGGQRMCPDRHFNKQEMIKGLAIMITVFDIEFLDDKRLYQSQTCADSDSVHCYQRVKPLSKFRRSGREHGRVGR